VDFENATDLLPRAELISSNITPLFRWRVLLASESGPRDYVLKGRRQSRTITAGMQRGVAHALATRMSRDCRCFPSLGRVAREAGYSERATRYAIRALEETGWLRVTLGGSPSGGRRTSSIYEATIPPDLQLLLGGDGGQGRNDPQSSNEPGHRRTTTPARRAPERDKNGINISSRETDMPRDRLSTWLDRQGVEYAVDIHAFEGELRQRFGITPGSPEASRLREEALALAAERATLERTAE